MPYFKLDRNISKMFDIPQKTQGDENVLDIFQQFDLIFCSLKSSTHHKNIIDTEKSTKSSLSSLTSITFGQAHTDFNDFFRNADGRYPVRTVLSAYLKKLTNENQRNQLWGHCFENHTYASKIKLEDCNIFLIEKISTAFFIDFTGIMESVNERYDS